MNAYLAALILSAVPVTAFAVFDTVALPEPGVLELVGIGGVVLVVIMLVSGEYPSWYWLLLFPAVLLQTMFNTGARVQEIADLRVRDLQLVKPFQVRLFGKGKKERYCPSGRRPPRCCEHSARRAMSNHTRKRMCSSIIEARRCLVSESDTSCASALCGRVMMLRT